MPIYSDRATHCLLAVCALRIVAGPALAQTCTPVQAAKLLADDGMEFDRFGLSVSVSGDTAVVGAWEDDNINGSSAGSAYVYRFDGTGWVQEAKLLAADGAAGDWFGHAVCISGDTVMIGAIGDGDNGTIYSGSVYVFRYDGAGWIQEDKLLAADGDAFDYFGGSVSVWGNTVVIGAREDDDNGPDSGSAYVFRFDGAGWVQEAKLLAGDGQRDEWFGNSVSVSGDTAVVGAPGDFVGVPGSAYVYRHDGTGWVQETKLLAADGAPEDQFGVSVSISGNTTIVGASLDDDNGTNSGSAYVFHDDGVGWKQETKLLAADGDAFDIFGHSVSVSGDTAVIGAYLADNSSGAGAGSAYVFRHGGTGWVQEAKLLADDGTAGDGFGFSVSVSAGTAAIGADFDDDNGKLSGSAYAFDLNCMTICLPDVNGDGSLDPTDFTAWIAAFNAGDPECDQNSDGACTFHDFTAWIANFNAGC